MDKQELKQKLDDYLAENFFEELEDESFADECFASEVPKAYASSARYFFARNIDFDKIFEDNASETFSEMMTRLVEESGEKNSAVYNRAQIDRQLFSRIKKNKDYQPSKDTAVALALALKLDFDKAKDFLASAGYTLTKSKRDLIITFFIENKIFDTRLLNDYLYEYNQPLLLGR